VCSTKCGGTRWLGGFSSVCRTGELWAMNCGWQSGGVKESGSQIVTNKRGASPGVEKEGESHRLAAATAMGKPTMPWESWKPDH
jgi:hypothetical protein